MPDLDYPERPKASPCGGFLTRSRGGEAGNFEVVIPWPDGGLAHFWRNNDDPAMPWHGPTIFGSGRYQGASVIESDFRAFEGRLGNLEVVAVAENGDAEHWWRETAEHLDGFRPRQSSRRPRAFPRWPIPVHASKG